MDFLVVHQFTEGLPGVNYSHSLLTSELLYLDPYLNLHLSVFVLSSIDVVLRLPRTVNFDLLLSLTSRHAIAFLTVKCTCETGTTSMEGGKQE